MLGLTLRKTAWPSQDFPRNHLCWLQLFFDSDIDPVFELASGSYRGEIYGFVAIFSHGMTCNPLTGNRLGLY